MAVVYDSSNGNQGYPPGGLSFTHSLGYGVGNNRIVLLAISGVGGTSHSVSTVTYNGVTMSLLGVSTSDEYFGRITSTRVYYLLDSALPSSSGSYTVSVTMSGAYDGVIEAASYTGVAQSAPPYAASDNDGSLSGQYSTNITLAAETGMIVDAGGGEDNGATAQSPGTSQTERQDRNYNSCLLAMSDKAFSSSGSNSMAWTPNGDYFSYCHVVVELATSGSGPSPVGEITLEGDALYASETDTPYNVSYTCHAGSNRKLLVGFALEYGGYDDGVTYDGVSLTFISRQDAGLIKVSWYYLDDADFPSTPGSYTLSCSTTESGAEAKCIMVLEVSGAEQGAVDDDDGTTIEGTDTITTSVDTLVNGSWIVGAIVCRDDGTWTADSGQTILDQTSGLPGASSYAYGYEEIPSSGTENMQWVGDASKNRIAQRLIAIAPAEVSEGGNAVIMGTNF